MDEDKVETVTETVGARLKAARVKSKLSLEDIAAQTRIPLRHLESVEESAWDRLPAPTYTIGFAKAYAGAVGLDRTEIGDTLREELGGQRYTAATPVVFEPADPARSMPKWLVIGAIVAVIVLVLLLSWLNERSLEDDGEPATNVSATVTPSAAPPAAQRPAAQGPVVIAASEQAWLQVYEKGGATYFSGMLNAGQNFTVPPSATAPMLKTAKPEALRVMVGNAEAPTVGPAGRMISDVSLLPADLLRAGAAPAPAPATAQPAAPAQRRPAVQPRRIAPQRQPSLPPVPAAPVPEPQANSAAQ
jgi:cytoskeletal protein RodZ